MQKKVGYFVDQTAKNSFFMIYNRCMNQWPDPRRELEIETPFGLTHVYSYRKENGEPIVLIHGASATSASWANHIIELGKHYHVFAIDTIGDAGRSIQAAPIQRSKDYSIWLDEVLQGLNLGKVHLIGSSYGGWITLNQVVHSPEFLHSITLVEPARALAGFTYRSWVFMIWASIIGPDFMRRSLYRWLDAYSISEEDQMQLEVAAMRYYKMRRIPPQYVSDEELKSVKLPSLLLLGKKSPLHKSQLAASRAKSLFQNVEVEIVPQTGPLLPVNVVNARILKFLESCNSDE